MAKKTLNTETEPDLDGSSIDTVEYEYTERDTEREKINIAYANSMRGRIGAYFGRLGLQLRALYDRFTVYCAGRALVFWTFLRKGIDFLLVFLYNEYCNKILRKDTKTMSKSNNKTDKNTKINSEDTAKSSKSVDIKAWGRGIIGIMTLFVVVSIAYSAWVIIQGTDDPVHRIMIVPMVVWAAVTLIKQFSKQGDK
jgi:hypothetical protein